MLIDLHIFSPRQGLTSITPQVQQALSANCRGDGLCTLFIRHTSASLLIQENYDDSARVDRDGQLLLGTWQGIYLWEHRYSAGERTVIMHIQRDAP